MEVPPGIVLPVSEDLGSVPSKAGDTIGSTVRDLQRGVEELTRAPLKPQQRLYILRLYHTVYITQQYWAACTKSR